MAFKVKFQFDCSESILFSVIENAVKWNIPLVDFHTHIGKVAIETTKGASQRINRPQDIVDLYEKLKFEIHSRLQSEPERYYIELPSLEDFVVPLYPLVKNKIYKDVKLKGWIADQIVSFPFNDIFHTKTNPKFVKSNEYVRHSLNKFEFAFRFIPFCRVDATEEKASDEVFNSAQLGAKGLKLHPLSQHWIDKIVTPECKKVLQTAGKLQLPTIFDVPNKGVAKDITDIASQARLEVDYPINVVLGHNGFDYSSPEMFEYICQPGMFTEISGMRGSDVELFFKNVRSVPNWFDKILFGTDANYFTVLQAADFITFLLSKDFQSLVEEDEKTTLKPLEIASRILGFNSLHLLPLNIQNKQNLNYSISSSTKKIINEITTDNLIISLKKLIQKKEIFFNLSLIPENESLEYLLSLVNNKTLISWVLRDNTTEKSSLILEEIPKESQLGETSITTFELFQKFCNNENKKENIESNTGNIQPITSLEELI